MTSEQLFESFQGRIPMRWLGIDFSGNHKMWRAGCSKSNVWVAEVRMDDKGVVLDRLYRVQELQGNGTPFARLRTLLSEQKYAAAAIDAPFSVPKDCFVKGHHELLRMTGKMDRPDERPFPKASDFVAHLLRDRTLHDPKPLRATENYWRSKGINVRSTLWAGPRGGAAMTAACLTLLYEANCPIWNWCRSKQGLLVEAFPAAQLCHWGLPYFGYSQANPEALQRRLKIIDFLSERKWLGSHKEYREKMESSADALDAVLCAFAARAVTTNNWVKAEEGWPPDEGLISVHN